MSSVEKPETLVLISLFEYITACILERQSDYLDLEELHMLFFPCYCSSFSQSISDSCISSLSLSLLTRTPVDVSSPCLLVENLLGFNGYCCCWLIPGDFTAPYLLRGGDFLSPLEVSVVVALYH